MVYHHSAWQLRNKLTNPPNINRLVKVYEVALRAVYARTDVCLNVLSVREKKVAVGNICIGYDSSLTLSYVHLCVLIKRERGGSYQYVRYVVSLISSTLFAIMSLCLISRKGKVAGLPCNFLLPFFMFYQQCTDWSRVGLRVLSVGKEKIATSNIYIPSVSATWVW